MALGFAEENFAKERFVEESKRKELEREELLPKSCLGGGGNYYDLYYLRHLL